MENPILIDGVDVARLSEAGRDRFRAAKIGYVFQSFNLLPRCARQPCALVGNAFGVQNSSNYAASKRAS